MATSSAARVRLRALSGAAFLMATSAIGPGFLTQTAVFTDRHRAAFAFAIFASVLIDIGAQWNVWRVIGVAGRGGPEIAATLSPALGVALRVLVILGGFVFNVGNIAGCALGLAIFGLDPILGATLSAVASFLLLAKPEATAPLDAFVKVLGVLMLALTAAVMVISRPDYALAARQAVWPDEIATGSILTLVGGTVGGYITFSGAHRLLASGISGPQAARDLDGAAIRGILVTGAMRALLFLAFLGVVSNSGAPLDPSNPAADAFRIGAGRLGELFFGVVLWSAAITSVVGCSYTSLSFLPGMGAGTETARPRLRLAGLLLFIVAALSVFITVGRPAQLLVWAGGLNGLVLPLSLGAMLVASRRQNIMGPGYVHPRAATVAGIAAWLASVWIAATGLRDLASRF